MEVTWINNAADIMRGLMTPAGILIGLIGLALWALSRPLDNPKMSSTGIKAMIGGGVLSASTAVIAFIQNVGGRVFTGG
jgi:hypothetical protein